jgi:hypothetical protein
MSDKKSFTVNGETFIVGYEVNEVQIAECDAKRGDVDQYIVVTPDGFVVMPDGCMTLAEACKRNNDLYEKEKSEEKPVDIMAETRRMLG